MAGVPPSVAIASGMIAGVLAFRSRPDILDVSAAFNLRYVSLREAFLNFVAFAAIGLPLALAIGFIKPELSISNLKSIPASAAAILLFNALPEEIFFRGILQHVIESALKSKTVAAILAAVIFGAAHLNNGPATPNYKYFVMATVAGLFYGRAWRNRKNVLTSTLTHTMVNTAWRLLGR